jgi:small GTP-binding protein
VGFGVRKKISIFSSVISMKNNHHLKNYFINVKSRQDKSDFLGGSFVGKTSIIIRYQCGNTPTTYSPTLNSGCISKDVKVGGVDKTLEIWDTAGQEKYRSLALIYYRDAHVAILVFGLTRGESLDVAYPYVREFNSNYNEKTIIPLCGNKADLIDQRKVDYEVANKFANDIKAGYTETSAIEGTGIETMFEEISCQVSGVN